MPLGLLCCMASRPPSRSRRCRLQFKVSKKEHLVCQPTSHQHGSVEVTSLLRIPSAYESQDAVARKYCSSPTAYAMLTFTYSGEPFRQSCVALLVLASCGMIPWGLSRPRHLAK